MAATVTEHCECITMHLPQFVEIQSLGFIRNKDYMKSVLECLYILQPLHVVQFASLLFDLYFKTLGF